MRFVRDHRSVPLMIRLRVFKQNRFKTGIPQGVISQKGLEKDNCEKDHEMSK